MTEVEVEKQINRVGKIIMAIIWSIPGALIGLLVRLFSYPTQFSGTTDLALQYLPWMGGGALLFAAFGWSFPNMSAFILEMLLGLEITKQ